MAPRRLAVPLASAVQPAPAAAQAPRCDDRWGSNDDLVRSASDSVTVPSPGHFTVAPLASDGSASPTAVGPFARSIEGALALFPFLHRRRPSRAAGLLAALLFSGAALAAAPAHAKDAPGRIALLPVRAGPGTKPKLAARATELLAQKLSGALPQSTLLGPADVARAVGPAKAKRLATCADPRCLTDVARATKAEAVLFGSLAKVGKSVALTLSTFEVRKISRRFTQRLPPTEDALDAAFDEALKKLFPLPPPPPPAPVVESSPEPEPAATPAPPPTPATAANPAPAQQPTAATANEPAITEPTERAHSADPFHIDARLQFEPSLDKLGLAGMAGFVGIGYAVAPRLAVELGGIIASSYGAELRLSWTPIDLTSDGSLRALVRLEGATLLFKPPTGATASGGITLLDRLALFGAGASVGIEYSPLPVLALGLEVPVLYLFNSPQLATASGTTQVSKFALFIAPFVSLRL